MSLLCLHSASRLLKLFYFKQTQSWNKATEVQLGRFSALFNILLCHVYSNYFRTKSWHMFLCGHTLCRCASLLNSCLVSDNIGKWQQRHRWFKAIGRPRPSQWFTFFSFFSLSFQIVVLQCRKLLYIKI